jgi:hypothetical protein
VGLLVGLPGAVVAISTLRKRPRLEPRFKIGGRIEVRIKNVGAVELQRRTYHLSLERDGTSIWADEGRVDHLSPGSQTKKLGRDLEYFAPESLRDVRVVLRHWPVDRRSPPSDKWRLRRGGSLRCWGLLDPKITDFKNSDRA